MWICRADHPILLLYHPGHQFKCPQKPGGWIVKLAGRELEWGERATESTQALLKLQQIVVGGKLVWLWTGFNYWAVVSTHSKESDAWGCQHSLSYVMTLYFSSSVLGPINVWVPWGHKRHLNHEYIHKQWPTGQAFRCWWMNDWVDTPSSQKALTSWKWQHKQNGCSQLFGLR